MHTTLGIPSRILLAGTAAGVILGATYALSPMAVWFVVACVGLMVWVGEGLPERERRWVLGLMAVALFLRVLAIVALFLMHDPGKQYSFSFFFDGDGMAFKVRSMWIATFWAGGRGVPYEIGNAFNELYGWSSYLYVLAYLQYILGPAPYGIHLLNITLFVAGGVFVFRFVRVAYGRLPAFAGLVFLLFAPTLFLWSVAALKESFQFFLMAATLISALEIFQPQSWRRRSVWVIVALLAVSALNTVRQGVLELATAAIGLGAVGTFMLRRRYVWIACAVILFAAAGYLLRSDAMQARMTTQLQRAATVHIGNVRTTGHSYKTLDAAFYATAYSESHPISMTGPQALRFVLRSMVSFVIVPLPWTVTSVSELVFLPAQIFWYALFLLAILGFMPGLRRHALLTLTIAAYFFAGAFIVGLNNGNVGTLVRLRDLVTPFVVWLSALGAVAVFVRVTSGKVRLPERVSRPSAVAAAVTGSSVAVQWLRRFAAESWLYRIWREFFSAPTKYIDGGIPREEEALALAHLDALMRRSRLFTVPAGWLARCLVAWPEAATVGFVMRHVSGLQTWQRVRLIGWIIAVAVVIEALFASADNAGALPFSVGAKLTFLALSALLMMASEPVAAAWNDRERWTQNS